MKKTAGGFILEALSVITCISLLLFSPSCKKETSSVAIITVLDSLTSAPIPGAIVRLHQDTLTSQQTGVAAHPPSPDREITDGRGQVTFTLTLPANYFAEVTTSSSSDTANTIVRFEDGKTVQVVILF